MKTKNFFTALLFVILSSAFANAQILEESFVYPSGDSLQQHGWTAFSGNVNGVFVTSPGLDYPGYQLQGTGNAVSLTNNGQDLYKTFTSNRTFGSVYAFFIVKVDSVKNTGDYFCAFLPSTNTNGFACRVYARKMITSGTNFSFGISKGPLANGIQWSDSVYTKGTNYLVCMKYTFNGSTNTDDEVSLFVFTSGVPSTEPAPTIGPITGTGTDVNDLGRFSLRQGTENIGSMLRIDEIFVGNGWDGTLPVELASFTSAASGRDVTLNWSTASEINNSGFDIERRDARGETQDGWMKISAVSGNGSTTSGHSYSFTDRSVESGNYNYRLKQIDYNGNFEYFDLVNEVIIGVPEKFSLSQNYPNPFNPTTNLEFGISELGFVSLKVYNASGKEVASIVNEIKPAGYYTFNFNASDLSSGVYFYRISAGNFTATKRMLLVK